MSLTEHDEFPHLGYPKNDSRPWKENYYFNYCDREAGALGLIHCSFMRDLGVVRLTHFHLIDGEEHIYISYPELPLDRPEGTPDSVVVARDHYRFEVVEPHKKHRLELSEDNFSAVLNYSDRFDVYDFPYEDDGSDKALDARHYEQGMYVEGEITVNGESRAVKCLGHRDHTWGFREESGLGGWQWIAIQSEKFSMNASRVMRKEDDDSIGGFISYQDRTHAVVGLDVLSVEHNDAGQPTNARYRVTLDNGETMHLSAKRFARISLPEGEGFVVHENFSEFLIEETGEIGVGVDEHMMT